MGDESGLCEELVAQRREGVLDRLVGAVFAYRLFEQRLLKQTHQIEGHHYGVKCRLGGPEIAQVEASCRKVVFELLDSDRKSVV